MFEKSIKKTNINFKNFWEDKGKLNLLEFVSILNKIQSSQKMDLNIKKKVEFLLSQSISILQNVILSPEGKQWIFISYNLIKSKNHDEFLQDYCRWRKFKLNTFFLSLINDLDKFILSILYQENNFEIDFNIKLKNIVFLPGVDLYSIDPNGVSLKIEKNKIEIWDKKKKETIENEFKQALYKFFTPLQSSSRYGVKLDTKSEAALLNIEGREYLGRLNPNIKTSKLIVEFIDKSLDFIKLSNYTDFDNLIVKLKYYVPLIPPKGALPSSSNSVIDRMIWYSHN